MLDSWIMLMMKDNKGLGVKETVNISGSLCQQLTNVSLEKLLQFGRIANLDKVEVYFGEDACTSPAGMYSFRNEISALSWILSLIPVSCKLEALRAAVTSRISEVAGGEKEEARVDDSYRCQKESRIVQWGQDNGVKTKLQIAPKLSGCFFSVTNLKNNNEEKKCLSVFLFGIEIDGYGRGAMTLLVDDVFLELESGII
uniref:Uncharacterized protein n=1 Tax=Noccaea caerulescens TaxID=107243 RepID=A0A1J3FMY0_NOCCA